MGLSFLLLQRACLEGELSKMRFVQNYTRFVFMNSEIAPVFPQHTYNQYKDNAGTLNVEVNIFTMRGLRQ